MKWIFALNEPSEELLEHGKKYEYFARMAVHSAKIHAPGLRPTLIYNGKENAFTRDLRFQGVEIIFHKLSFESEVERCDSRDELWRQTAKGAMLRLDIPEIIDSDEVVLYTDTDVFFLQDPTKYVLSTNFIAVAPEFDINDFSKVNTGSMLINLKEARFRFKALIDWTVKNLHLIPDYDQGAIRAFFNGDWDRLDPVMNWKPYWGLNDKAIILHFHGPKPSDFDPLTLQPLRLGGVYEALYSKNKTAYEHYVSKWVGISHQYHLSSAVQPVKAAIRATAPLVTVLMPAVRTSFFEETLNSVLSQTVTDLQVIVSDNTADAKVLSAFREKYTDARIKWIHAFPVTNGLIRTHMEFLFDNSKTRYTRFVFDDDILYPASTETLLSMLESHDLQFAAHGRHYLVNNHLYESQSIFAKDKITLLNEKEIASLLYKTNLNHFGEPSFAMYDTESARSILPMTINTLKPLFLGDVFGVVCFGKKGKVGVFGGELGAFRMHGSQESSEGSPIRLLGYIEWELIGRYLNEEYQFGQSDFEVAKASLLRLYRSNTNLQKQLSPFISSLEAISSAESFVVSDDFIRSYLGTGLYQN